MNILQLLKKIKVFQGKIFIQNEQLILDIPQQFLDKDMVNNLKKSKYEIIKILKIENWIKQTSDNYGGDDPIFLEEYTNEVLRNYENELDKTLNCFRDLAKQKPAINRQKQEENL